MTSQTVPELTRYEYNELSYNSAKPLITGNFMYQVCDLINKCGIDVKITDTYDEDVANAVSEFQKLVEMTSITGILTTPVLQSMILYSERISDTVIDDSTSEEEILEEYLELSSHYTSFFDDDKLKIHRRNNKDIKIVFGNKSITKTIKNVFVRSVGVEVDTSGNPIAEIYEFIARDVIESDEITDASKYSETDYLSTEIPYDFSAITNNVVNSSSSNNISYSDSTGSNATDRSVGGGRKF